MHSRVFGFVAGLVVLVVGFARVARADDAYFALPVAQVKLPANATTGDEWRSGGGEALVLDGEGEAYLYRPVDPQQRWRRPPLAEQVIVVKAEAGKGVRGRLVVPNQERDGFVSAAFTIDADKAKAEYRVDFWRGRAQYCRGLANAGVPGAAYFRVQAATASKLAGDDDAIGNDQPNWRGGNDEELFDLFSGGRAVAENLQLDRDLPARAGEPKENPSVDVKSLEGITIAEMDFKSKLNGPAPALDVLASVVPADQHAVFVPSFAALMSLVDEGERFGSPVGAMARMGPEDSGVLQRYERQLCLSRTGLAKLLGPALVASVVLTGSDPYFPTGTDVALVFEPKDAAGLMAALSAQVTMNAARAAGVKELSGTVGGVAYTGRKSDDDAVRVYLAKVGAAVVVTNSLAQLEWLADVAAGKSPALASLPEYVYFRTRYSKADEETALVMISDATIRRWCSAQWRIASARRTVAAAYLNRLTAEHVDEIMSGSTTRTTLASENQVDLGAITVGRDGVRSSLYGSLAFMTPISEMLFEKVTPTEATRYKAWREGYQRNWRWAFDPIALRLNTGATLKADLSILPLILSTDYREIASIAIGSQLKPGDADPHAALLQVAIAINKEAKQFQESANLLGGIVPAIKVNPLGWIGTSASIFMDDDALWAEVLAKPAPDRSRYIEKNLGRLPVGVNIGVSDSLKLAGFLTAVRGFVEQSAPNMAKWETRKHGDMAYLRVGATQRLVDGPELALYYTTLPGALVMSLNEGVITRAIDRSVARQNAAADAPKPVEWLGDHLAGSVDRRALEMLNDTGAGTVGAMQSAAWECLPILSEWKRRYPKEDPAAVHERLWGVKLAPAGGSGFAWNESYRAMESVAYGHPHEPKAGPSGIFGTDDFQDARFGLTFEDQGLRAKVEVRRGK